MGLLARVLLLAALLAGVGATDSDQKALPQQPALSEGQLLDRQGLLALKAAISNFGSSKARSWKQSGSPCQPKPWPHVRCVAGRVASLQLSNLNIQATLPLQLRQLAELQELKLDGNRITGTVPDGWADARAFVKLETLDLHDNQLTGTLPSVKWNRKGAFRALRSLSLASNSFYGGLPWGWLGTNKVFSGLKYLDLSKNMLGTADGTPSTQYDRTSGWCTQGPAAVTDGARLGWCPGISAPAGAKVVPLPGTMSNLITLDLSDNVLLGSLPPQWPLMFPRLQYLLLSDNQLFAWALPAAPLEGRPASLPTAWTRAKYPTAFPALLEMALYPGNDNICFLPSVSSDTLQIEGYREVNPDGTYRIFGSDGEQEFSSSDPWPCASPSHDNPPGSLSLTADSAGFLQATWTAPDADLAGFVFGYQITLSKESTPGTDDYWPLPGYQSVVLRTYRDAGFASIPSGWLLTESSSGSNSGPVLYTLSTHIKALQGVSYRLEVAAFNLDGLTSSVEAVEEVLGVPDQPSCSSGQQLCPTCTYCAASGQCQPLANGAGCATDQGGYAGTCQGGACVATGCNDAPGTPANSCGVCKTCAPSGVCANVAVDPNCPTGTCKNGGCEAIQPDDTSCATTGCPECYTCSLSLKACVEAPSATCTSCGSSNCKCDADGVCQQLPMCVPGSGTRCGGSSPACRCEGFSSAGPWVCAADNTCQLPMCAANQGDCRAGAGQTCRCTSANLTCNTSSGLCQLPTCTPGSSTSCGGATQACRCDGASSAGAWVCQPDNTCQLPVCAAGQGDCRAGPNQACRCTGANVCNASTGVCQLPVCTVGSSALCGGSAPACRCEGSSSAGAWVCTADNTCQLPVCVVGQGNCRPGSGQACRCMGTNVCDATGICQLPVCAVGGSALCGGSTPACRCEGSSSTGAWVCAADNTCKLPVCAVGQGDCRAGSGQACRCTGTNVCSATTGVCQLPVCTVGSSTLCGGSAPACRCEGSSSAGAWVCAADNTCKLPVCTTGQGDCRAGSGQACRCTGTNVCSAATGICQAPAPSCPASCGACMTCSSNTNYQCAFDYGAACKAADGSTGTCFGGGCQPCSTLCLSKKEGDTKCLPAAANGMQCGAPSPGDSFTWVCQGGKCNKKNNR